MKFFYILYLFVLYLFVFPFMYNVEKWPSNSKNVLVFTPQDFYNMFDHFATLCMKDLGSTVEPCSNNIYTEKGLVKWLAQKAN